MFQLQVDENTARKMMQDSIDKRVEELSQEQYFMDFKQLCTFLNLSKPVITEKLLKNGLPYYRSGSKYLFKRDEVNEFLDQMTAQMNIKNNNLQFFEGLKKEDN